MGGAIGLIWDEDLVDPTSALLGTVRAHRDGVLLGWAELTLLEDPHAALVQGVYAPRHARRLALGSYDARPAGAEEREVLRLLFAHAAHRASVAGLRTLRWHGEDTGPEGDAARASGADQGPESARVWRVALAPSPDAPAVAGDVRVVARDASGAPVAEIVATVLGDEAYVNAGEAIRHADVGDGVLTRLLAELTGVLRDEHPGVRELVVFEFDDGKVRRALAASELRVTGRIRAYELRLGP